MSKDTGIKVSKMILETTDGKKIELSLAEAKELHTALDALFGEKVTHHYLPSQPIYIDRYVRPYPYWSAPIWCSTNGGVGAVGPLSTGMAGSALSMKSDSGLQLSYVGESS